ncbi:Valine--tRNA ligase [Neochlamydia sp. EPS4]|uniref:valine--tRNA ligase n=1 Tax=Neochlamydia sp. EPS4 TaxID=1478175 RepID=UPI000583C73A|nr:valine--tRNA ligase [Neochlamydia sp. EPS4]KIC72460.1 Valine--tRNA ligase [Neochlamydia sp. EPS4]
MMSQFPFESTELPKAYEAKNVDAKWFRFWESKGYFSANPNSPKKPFCIVIPPPNVTGQLHMGHALTNTLQDVLIRWKRMSGFETLWVPGTDHAGISTQTVVERHLIKTTGKKRKDFSREEFLQHVWKWKEENESRIINQLKKMGCSCDWARQRFTLDEGNNRAVKTMFKKLYEMGLIYRGDYLVNWDPVTQTALADDEVEYEEKQSFLWFFQYPLSDASGFVSFATTRPETMLGDTALAVSPKDPRYAQWIGKTVYHPLTQQHIPLIADHLVDPDFGTGVVKITPAHDPIDYQIGLSHHLPFINIMTPDGKINEKGGKYAGLSMEEARQAVIEEMQQQGLLKQVVPHLHRVGVSYRSKAIIQPYMSKQWFIKMEGFAKKLRAALTEERIHFIPKNWENTYLHWIDNLRDWCISRQLWWGHRIPVWYHRKNPENIICYEGEGLPREIEKNPYDWVQEEDVLDTWFSSGLWPFAALGWPEQNAVLKKFYPNSVLITGHDILFFWVARMIFMGEQAMEQVPFPDIYLHGLIYGKSYWRKTAEGGISYLTDKERLEYDLGKPTPPDVQSNWEKMSKTKGNVIDPLEIIDEYGTDAMRMALCASANQAREIDLDRRRFEEFRNFANKIWNGARFIFMNLQGEHSLSPEEFAQGLNKNILALEDRWILSVLNRVVDKVNTKLAHYQFDQAALEAYDFFWKEFCSYYLEIAKPILFGKQGTSEDRKNKQKLLAIVLCQSMRLIHPMAPFISEELFQQLKRLLGTSPRHTDVDLYTQEAIEALQSPACIVAPYPQVTNKLDCHAEIDHAFNIIENVVYLIRNLRGEMKLPLNTVTNVHIVGKEDDKLLPLIKENTSIIKALIKINEFHLHYVEKEFGLSSSTFYQSLKIIIPIPEELMKQEKARLLKEKERLNLAIDKINIQLANHDFVAKAPAPLIQKHTEQLAQAKKSLEEVTTKLSQLT